MQYYSLQNPQHKVSFREAVIRGLAPDKGLYFPMEIPRLEKDFIERLEEYDPQYIARKVMQPFIGAVIPVQALTQIIRETLTFPFRCAKWKKTYMPWNCSMALPSRSKTWARGSWPAASGISGRMKKSRSPCW